MKKKTIFLFVISLLLSIFVSAQITKPLNQIDIKLDHITIIRDSDVIVKNGTFDLVFTSKKGEILFQDSVENSTMTLQLGEIISSRSMTVKYHDSLVDATALIFDAKANKTYDVTLIMVMLDVDKSLYALGVTLSNFTISIIIPEGKGK